MFGGTLHELGIVEISIRDRRESVAYLYLFHMISINGHPSNINNACRILYGAPYAEIKIDNNATILRSNEALRVKTYTGVMNIDFEHRNLDTVASE